MEWKNTATPLHHKDLMIQKKFELRQVLCKVIMSRLQICRILRGLEWSRISWHGHVETRASIVRFVKHWKRFNPNSRHTDRQTKSKQVNFFFLQKLPKNWENPSAAGVFQFENFNRPIRYHHRHARKKLMEKFCHGLLLMSTMTSCRWNHLQHSDYSFIPPSELQKSNKRKERKKNQNQKKRNFKVWMKPFLTANEIKELS